MNVSRQLWTTPNCANKTPFALTLRVVTNVPAHLVSKISMKRAKVSTKILVQFRNNSNQCKLILLGQVETPPPVQQITPPDAEGNRLKVLITGLVTSTVREM